MTRPLTNFEGVQIMEPQCLTRIQRLERWAVSLERRGGTVLKLLGGTEHQGFHERPLMREDNSPLTVAFEDPILRSCGMQGDEFGEALRFFELSDEDLHYIVCECHSGSTVPAIEVAARVRAVKALAIERTTSLYAGIVTAVLGTGLLLVLSA